MSENYQNFNVKTFKLHLQKFEIIDCVILGLILLISIAIGVFFIIRKNFKNKLNYDDSCSKTNEELQYLIGNRKMKEFPVAMSLIASFISGISIIGLSTEIYMYGILYAYTIPTIILGGLICWYIFLPVFCNLQLTSIYEYFEMRFDKKIRLFGSFVNFIGITFWMPMVIYVPGLVMNQFTGINIYVIAGIISIICIFYTCVGGITAVIWADFFQSFIMLISVMLIMFKGLLIMGGFNEIFKMNYEGERIELPDITLDPTVRYSLMAILIGGTVSWTESTCCGQVMMQRFLSVSSVRKAQRVLIYYIIGIIILMCVCIFNGLILYAYYHNCDPLMTKLATIKDQLLPIFVMEIFYDSPGMNGLFIGGILSAALSTLSTGLNSLAAIFLEDFLKTIYSKKFSEYQTKIILKLIVIFFGVISFVLVFLIENLGMIFQLSRTLSAICGGPLFGLFLIGVLMPWINSKNALLGCSTSFILMSWICIKNHIDNSNHMHKPLTTAECSYTFEVEHNITNFHNFNNGDTKNITNQSISYLWYSPIGAFVTILIANCGMICFGYISRTEWNRKLIATFLRKYVPEVYEKTTNLKKIEESLLL